MTTSDLAVPRAHVLVLAAGRLRKYLVFSPSMMGSGEAPSKMHKEKAISILRSRVQMLANQVEFQAKR